MQCGDGFVEEGQDQAVFEIVRRLVVGRNLRLLRLAVFPAIEALAVLLAALAGFRRCGEGGRNRQAEERREFGAHAGSDIQAHGVDEFDRPHRHAELHRRLVQHRAGNAFGIGGDGFQHVREQQAVDQEAGRAGDWHRQLVDGLAERGETLRGVRRHAVVLDDFHQRHHRHRIEVMQTGELRWPRDVLAQFGQRDGGRIGGEQRVGLHLRLDRGVEVALGVGSFDDGFDEQVGAGDAGTVEIGHQSRRHLRPLARVLHALGEQFLRTRHGGVDETLFAILERDLEALVGRPGGDIAAHHPGADHVDVGDAMILAAKTLQPFLQEIHAGEIACGRRGGEFHYGFALGIQACADAVAGASAPGLDQRVWRGVMFLARLACGHLDHFRRDQLAREPRVGGPGHESLFEGAFDALECERGCGFDQARRVHDLVDQADRARRRCREAAAGEHHVHGSRGADQLRQTGAAAPAREDAQHHFGQADLRRRIVRGHAIAAGQRYLGAAAHAEAVDRGDGGEGQFRDALEEVLAAADRVADGAFCVELLEFADVGAGDETLFLGRAQHQRLRRFQRDAFEQAVQFDQHALSEGVHRLAFAVEGQHQHAVWPQFGLPVAQTQAVEAG